MLFGAFSALLALALLLHQVWWHGFEVASPHLAVVLTAFAVLARPSSVRRFLLMLGVETAVVAAEMPGAGSHTLMVGVLGACVLAFTAWLGVRERRLPEAGELFERLAPFARASLVVLYAAAALAKLNGGFFDPAVSCGVALSSSIAFFDPELLRGASLDLPATWGTVLVEASLPVLLVVRRTRSAGLVLGCLFHLVLALAGNVPFSSLVLALYVAFLPGMSAALRRPALGRRARLLVLGGLGAGWLAAAALLDPVPSPDTGLVAWATRGVVVAEALAGLVLVLGLRTTPPVRLTLRAGHPVFAAGVALLVLNAAGPYLGLKTESAFTMFSNLQTEAGSWNHAFVPEAVRVFPYQDRLATVVASNEPALLRRTSGGTRIVEFELQRFVHQHPGTWARYTLRPGGEERSAGPGGGGGARLVLDRVAKFRDVRAAGRRGC